MVYSFNIIAIGQCNRGFSVNLTGERTMLPKLEPISAPAARGTAVRATNVPCGIRICYEYAYVFVSARRKNEI